MRKTTVRNLCIAGAALGVLVVILPKPAPRDPVENSAAYLREKLPDAEMRHWISPYLDRSPENLDAVVAEFVAKEEKRGKLSNDPNKLDRLLSSALPSFFIDRSTSTPERREKILANARARMAAPPMAMVRHQGADFATIDFWVVPGEWRKPLRQASEGRMEMRADGTAFDGKQMRPEFFREGLRRVSERFPGARAYEIRARIPDGSSSELVRMVYFPEGNHFEKDDGGDREFAPGPEGGMAALLAGSSDISGLKFVTLNQEDPSPGYTLAPAREPLEE